MRIIIHMGLPKTGSTALQMALAQSRPALAQAGILYPAFQHEFNTHYLLMGLDPAAPEATLWPWLIARHGGLSNLRSRAEASYAEMLRQVQAKRPRLLILSSEVFLEFGTADSLRHLAGRLRQISDDISLMAYIREPAAMYLSLLQQRARSQALNSLPALHRFRDPIERAEAAFGVTAQLRGYDPALLEEGDVVTDFVTHVLDRAIDPALLPRLRANESLSAEAVCILPEIRRARLQGPGSAGVHDPVDIAALGRLDRSLPGFAAPRLRPGLAEELRRGGSEYLWLRDRAGIVFPAIDYDRIDGTRPAFVAAGDDFKTLLEVDQDRLLRLAAVMLTSLPLGGWGKGGWRPGAAGIGIYKDEQGIWRLRLGRHSRSLRLSNIRRNLRRLFGG